MRHSFFYTEDRHQHGRGAKQDALLLTQIIVSGEKQEWDKINGNREKRYTFDALFYHVAMEIWAHMTCNLGGSCAVHCLSISTKKKQLLTTNNLRSFKAQEASSMN